MFGGWLCIEQPGAWGPRCDRRCGPRCRAHVWECSHTGGHRFAPAMVILPEGLTYGRVDGEDAVRAVAQVRRNRLSLNGFRGRSGLSPVEQVAEIAVRERVPAALGQLTVTAVEPNTPISDSATFAGAAEVTHTDGRRWLVTTRTVGYPPRQASCGAAPKPASAIVVDEIRETT
ncbi:sucrase ferredoxin [Nocardia nova]|uniref:sucrase ferredoxin n=1 Tax=Nocardia nova TaxID=37330 RepID=UPI002B4B0DE3|nr:sucrase ferredoxin [Nocardia nova]